MDHKLVTAPDAGSVAIHAAGLVASRVLAAVASRGAFVFAASGGKTPWAMFGEFARCELPWASIKIYQADERVAADGDAARNLTHLRESLGARPAAVVPMPVNSPDLEAAAAAYASHLPDRFDLVHLGLGADGHTASLVPGDPVLEVTDELVAVTRPYQGHRRMTLTYPGLARADEILWLVTGAGKRDVLARLLAGDESIPAARVRAGRSVILADAAAAEGLGHGSQRGPAADGRAGLGEPR